MSQERQATGLRDAFSQPIPIRTEYATLPIQDGFDWARCFRSIPDAGLYLVVFRSVRRPSADLGVLKELDDRAYAEAMGAGGLLHYFRGEANERRECLSFCLWESRQHALEAVGGPSHRAAAEIWRAMYESYELERYHLEKTRRGSVSFERLTA
jgi:heme-degrading monooxygenase HmoA